MADLRSLTTSQPVFVLSIWGPVGLQVRSLSSVTHNNCIPLFYYIQKSKNLDINYQQISELKYHQVLMCCQKSHVIWHTNKYKLTVWSWYYILLICAGQNWCSLEYWDLPRGWRQRNTVRTALNAAQLAVRRRGFPSQRVSLPRCKFKSEKKQTKKTSM